MIESTGVPAKISQPLTDTDLAKASLQASVIVCAYTEERWPQIQLALDSVVKQTVRPCQVIVVSDHNPALFERLKAEYPEFDVIANEFSPGLSGARNSGVEHAVGDIVVFLDDDARAEPGWLEALLASYVDESVLGVGGQVLPEWATAEKPGWFPDEFLWVVGCTYTGLPETKAEIRNPVGANMSFRRSAFDKAGHFEASMGRNLRVRMPSGCEETEFSIRLLAVSPGCRILYEPGAVVHHYVGEARGTWRYFLHRCFAEGCSKERVARLSNATAALSSERSYVAHTLRRAMGRELSQVFLRGSADAAGRLAALTLGVTWAAAGYARSFAAQGQFLPFMARQPE
jgi:glucosyl-dolichyl phosphate glucuronosyltransferase